MKRIKNKGGKQKMRETKSKKQNTSLYEKLHTELV